MAKYSKGAGDKVGETMHEMKEGKLQTGSGKKVTSRKQAIAIGLSEARERGAKVPAKKTAAKAGSKTGAKSASKSASKGGAKTASKSTTRGGSKTAAKGSSKTAAKKAGRKTGAFYIEVFYKYHRIAFL